MPARESAHAPGVVRRRTRWTDGRVPPSGPGPTFANLPMRKVNGKHIVPISHSGVVGHVMRTHSGVKIAEFYGRDSLSRAINAALEGYDGTDVTLGEWYGAGPRGGAS
jgi:hypothetical protein